MDNSWGETVGIFIAGTSHGAYLECIYSGGAVIWKKYCPKSSLTAPVRTEAGGCHIAALDYDNYDGRRRDCKTMNGGIIARKGCVCLNAFVLDTPGSKDFGRYHFSNALLYDGITL